MDAKVSDSIVRPPSLLKRVLTAVTGQTVPRIAPFKEMGTGGTAIYGGLVRTFERSSKWTGTEKYRTASEIATNVSIVAASVHHFLNLLGHPQWTVKPAEVDGKVSPEAEKAAQFVEDVMHDMATTWPRIVRRAGMYRFHGFGLQEWTAKKRDDGQIGFADIEGRPQHTVDRWEVDENGVVTGVWQRHPMTGVVLGLPRGKLVYLVEDTLTDSPEGLGMFRHLAEPYERFKTYLELEARAFERDLRGTPIGRAPISLLQQMVKDGKLTKDQAQGLIDDLKNFVQLEMKQSDTSLVLDSVPYQSQAADGLKIAGAMQWGIDLLQGNGAGLAELNVAIDRLQREMARILGTESLMMGDQGGNRALAVDKSRNLYLIANAVLDNIAAAFDRDILIPLWKLNGFDDALKPTFVPEDVTFKDVAEVTAALRDMATAGAVLSPDDPVIDDVRDLLGVSRQPERSEEELALLRNQSMGIPPPGSVDAATVAEREAKITAMMNGTGDNKAPGKAEKEPAAEKAALLAKAIRLAQEQMQEGGRTQFVVAVDE